MASRMDRYSNKEVVSGARSDRNKSLYKQIEDMDSYTNIEGVANIGRKNSIDLEAVKELLGNKEKKTKGITVKEKQEVIEEDIKEETYDINELLTKMKETNKTVGEKYRSLNSKQRQMLKELNAKNKKKRNNKDSDIEDIDEFVKTISNMNPLKEDSTDDIGLFDDLKSDTMVGDASSIKKIIDEEKELTRGFEEMDLDKSFYTASFGFTQRDFEELKDMNHKIKKDNKFIITLLIILIVLIIVGVIMFILK